MKPSRLAPVAGVLALELVASALLGEAAVEEAAAQGCCLDLPQHIAANADGDVYVSSLHGPEEAPTCGVRRFDADGNLLASWAACENWGFGCDVAASGDGGVYVADSENRFVRRFSRDGQAVAEWPVMDMQEAIATSYSSASGETEVFGLSWEGVLRYGPVGGLRASFPVSEWSYDLAVWPQGGEDGAFVDVVEPTLDENNSVVRRYNRAGSWLYAWQEDGVIAGMEVDSTTSALWYGVADEVNRAPRVMALNRDRTLRQRCDLTEYPIDLTIGRGGDLYLLTYRSPDSVKVPKLHRYRQDCTPVDVWDIFHLGGWSRLWLPTAVRGGS